MATAELYRLTAGQAQDVLDEVRKVLVDWRQVAQSQGLAGIEITRMGAVIQA